MESINQLRECLKRETTNCLQNQQILKGEFPTKKVKLEEELYSNSAYSSEIEIGNNNQDEDLNKRKRTLLSSQNSDISNSNQMIDQECESTTLIQQSQPKFLGQSQSITANSTNKRTMTTVLQNQQFSCLECDFQTSHQITLEKHTNIFHRQDKSLLKCEMCSFTTMQSIELYRHQQNQHNEEKIAEIYECEKCEYTTISKSSFKRHQESVHSAQSIKCDQCNFISSSALNLKRHKNNVHTNKVYYCEQCDYVGIGRRNYQQHVSIKHPIQYYDCHECNYKAPTKTMLNCHIKLKHKESGKVYQCPLCDYKGNNKYNYNKHKQNLHSTNIMECSEEGCSFKTKNMEYLRKHMKHIHKISSSLKHKRDIQLIKQRQQEIELKNKNQELQTKKLQEEIKQFQNQSSNEDKASSPSEQNAQTSIKIKQEYQTQERQENINSKYSMLQMLKEKLSKHSQAIQQTNAEFSNEILAQNEIKQKISCQELPRINQFSEKNSLQQQNFNNKLFHNSSKYNMNNCYRQQQNQKQLEQIKQNLGVQQISKLPIQQQQFQFSQHELKNLILKQNLGVLQQQQLNHHYQQINLI